MTYIYIEYEELKTRLLTSITNLAKQKGYPNAKTFIDAYMEDKANPDQLAKEYSKLSSKRRKQIAYALTTIRCLDHSSSQEEKKYNPDKSWSNYITSFATNEKQSVFFKSIFNSLNISKENKPSSLELSLMFSGLKQFMLSQIYSDSKSTVLSPNNPYCKNKIENFEWTTSIAELSARIAGLEDLSHQDANSKNSKGTITNSGFFKTPSIPIPIPRINCKASVEPGEEFALTPPIASSG
jgi:hypothetical protein